MFTHWKRNDDRRRRLKRERSGSVTVIGDNEVDEDGDDDVVFVRTGQAPKRARLGRQLPGEGDEVIVLDWCGSGLSIVIVTSPVGFIFVALSIRKRSYVIPIFVADGGEEVRTLVDF
jgi:hypothetical protein